ncbi:hypothetical protein GY45DRAFT_1324630, partial [Cubamyces sp. BRFM 1775]
MPPKGYVQCSCHDCSGSSRTSKNKQASSARSKVRNDGRDSRLQNYERPSPRDTVMEEAVRMDDERPSETHANASGGSQDANKDASWAICPPQWAFITSSLSPSSPSPSSLSPSSDPLPTPNVLVNSFSKPASTQDMI